MKNTNPNIGIVTFPVSKAGVMPLNNLVDIVKTLSNQVSVITGDQGYQALLGGPKVNKYQIKHNTTSSNVFPRSINFIKTQLKISKLVTDLRKVNLWLFFLGGDDLVIPVLIAKLLRKKVIMISAGSPKKVAQSKNDRLAFLLGLVERISYCLSDNIVLYSERLIEEYGLKKYKNKIKIAHQHYLDFSKFKITKPFENRGMLVGYVGRLGEEKGIMRFLEAIPMVLEKHKDIRFIVVGDGELREKVTLFIANNKIDEFVKLCGWIEHEKLPEYLNEIKLLVLPSFTEGLPGVILEAMACGTPVLATGVGAVLDLIQDGETGFIIENNSPGCIAENIIKALNYPGLAVVSANGRAFVESNFTFERAANDYNEIIKSVFSVESK